MIQEVPLLRWGPLLPLVMAIGARALGQNELDEIMLLQTAKGRGDFELEGSPDEDAFILEQQGPRHLLTLRDQQEEDLNHHLEAMSLRGGFDLDDAGAEANIDELDDNEEGPPPQKMGFARFDQDNSGAYDRRELAAFLREHRNASDTSIQEVWEMADLDGNALIDYDEFMDCVVNAASCYKIDDPEDAAMTNLMRTPTQARLDINRAQRQAARRMEALDAAWNLQESLPSTPLSHWGKDVRVERHQNRSRVQPAVLPPQVAAGTMRLHLMPDKGLHTKYGAACLDGSDAGFYFAPAATPQAAGKWLILLMGGAWCAGSEECMARTRTALGSSAHFPPGSYRGGIMSSNCTVNPAFCNFNKVIMAYCDGTSFTGDRESPVMVNTSGVQRPLYFRGKRILDAVLDTLLTKHGLNQSEHVMLAGVSAGGVSALVHADHIGAILAARAPAITRFRVLPLSGFFLKHNNVENQAVWPIYMWRMVNLANSTPSLNKRCLDDKSPGKKWTCIFPEVSYEYTKSPVFLVNAAYDWWASLCLLYSAKEPLKVSMGSGSCGRSHKKAHYPCGQNVERCTPFELFAVNQWIRDFSSTLEGNPAFTKAGNGAFIHSCHTHAEALEDKPWAGVKVGGRSMQQAVLRWWRSDGAPSAAHYYEPCLYKQGGNPGADWPYQCNPTCHSV